ncbi:MAG: hypothetical protein HFJ29_09385 [Clostridia bacterium]|nr:hypothetical protein [Clostridia bacterium]
MSFSNMLEILKEKNKERVVFVKLGPFYIATGKDAVFLNRQLGLKCICFKKEVCKVGIPETRIEYYLEKLARIDLAYIAYCFDSQKKELTEKYRSDGSYHKEYRENKDCLICTGIRSYPKDDRYLIALQKMQEKELKNKNGK